MEAGARELHEVFIRIDVHDSVANDPEMAATLEEVCPVDIYTDAAGKVEVVKRNLDECVLCELCLDAAPDGMLAIQKLYDGTELRR